MLAQTIPGTEYWWIYLAVTVVASAIGLMGFVMTVAGKQPFPMAMGANVIAVVIASCLVLAALVSRGSLRMSSHALVGLIVLTVPIVIGIIGIFAGLLRRKR
jgi:hypothetical protein